MYGPIFIYICSKLKTITMMKKLLFLLAVFAFGLTGFAQVSFDGGPAGTGTAWDVSENWDSDAIPVSTDDVLIDAAFDVLISSAGAVAASLDISTGSLTVGPLGTLTVSGALVNTVGVDGLVVKSTISGTGSIIQGSGTPAATVERYIPMEGWHFVAPSTTGVTAENFYVNDIDSAWLTNWDEPSGLWEYITETTENLSLGTGYSYWWKNGPTKDMTTPGTAEFKGNLLNPDGTYTVALSLNGSGETAGFNLVGNPWPCAIHVDPDLINALTNCEQSVWVWNNSMEWFEWAAYNPEPSGSNNNPFETIDYIAVGQGAYLRATSAGASVDFFGPERGHAPDAPFYKESEEVSGDDVNPIIQLLLTKNDRTNHAYVMFGENGSTGFENGSDVTKMFGSELNSYVYLNEEDHNYAQNYLSLLEIAEERVVDVYVRVGSEGEHTFAVNMEYIPNTLVVLEDTETGILTEMNNDVVYTFDAAPGDVENRFKLHFTYGVTGIENPGATQNTVGIYAYDKAVYITNKENATYETAQVSIYDMYGRQIYSNQTRLENLTRIPVNVNNSYLVVRVTNGSDTFVQKVFIK